VRLHGLKCAPPRGLQESFEAILGGVAPTTSWRKERIKEPMRVRLNEALESGVRASVRLQELGSCHRGFWKALDKKRELPASTSVISMTSAPS